MASSKQYTTMLITIYKKLNKKCNRYETIRYDVEIFSHKQLSSGLMNSIPVSLFPICIFIELGPRNTYRLPRRKWRKKKIFCGFPSSLCAERNFKRWTRTPSLQASIHITVVECFCVETSNRKLQVLNHSSLGLRIFFCFYWAKNTPVTQ